MRNFVKLLEIFEIVAGAVALVGILVYFNACGKHDDVYPSCHWAQIAVMTLIGLLLVHALLALMMPAGRLKAGISVAMIPTALLLCIIPGFIIPLCPNSSMRCVSRFQPFSLVMGLVIAGLALIHTLFAILSSRPPKPEKKNGEDIRMASRGKKTDVQDFPETPVEDEWSYVDPEGIE